MNNQEFTENLKSVKLKQSEFARMTGSSQRQVARWINGEAPVPFSAQVILNIYIMLRAGIIKPKLGEE